jgi:hypothetical protein
LGYGFTSVLRILTACRYGQMKRSALRTAPFGGIFPLPMLVQSIGDFGQPRPIFDQFQQFSRGKELDAIVWRIGIPSLVLGTLIFFLVDWIVKAAYRDRSG